MFQLSGFYCICLLSKQVEPSSISCGLWLYRCTLGTTESVDLRVHGNLEGKLI